MRITRWPSTGTPARPAMMRFWSFRSVLQHLVEMAGVLLADRGGARLLQILKAPLSRTCVLFHVMRMSLPSAATPWMLGVDDFALYADVYGTLLVGCSRSPASGHPGPDTRNLFAFRQRRMPHLPTPDPRNPPVVALENRGDFLRLACGLGCLADQCSPRGPAACVSAHLPSLDATTAPSSTSGISTAWGAVLIS